MITELNLDLYTIKTVLENPEIISAIDIKILEKESQKIISDFKEFAEKHGCWDSSTFITWFLQVKNVELSTDELQYFKSMFKSVSELNSIDSDILLTELRKQKLWKDLVHIKTTDFDLTEVHRKVIEAQEGLISKDKGYVDGDLVAAIGNLNMADGLTWRLKGLNDIIGKIYKGVFTLVASYRDGGKTAMAISEATHMALQLPDEVDVLYFNNEEHDSRLVYRLYQSLLAAPLGNIFKQPENAEKKYVKLLGRRDKIKVFNVFGKSFKYIEQKCAENNPGLIIIDQLDNLSFDPETHRAYNELYSRTRNLANMHAPVIALTQASGDAKYFNKEEGRHKFVEWLDSSQIHHSRVDKQSATDVLITIGISNADKKLRNIEVHRCKMSGLTGKFCARMQNEIMRFSDIEVNVNEVF